MLTKTKKKKCRVRCFHPCKNARKPGNPCKCVLCDDCLLKGIVGTGVGRSSRSTGVKNKGGKHAADENGCMHSDYSTFQHESGDLYYNKEWREKNPDKCLDENCLNCKKDMYEGQFIEWYQRSDNDMIKNVRTMIRRRYCETDGDYYLFVALHVELFPLKHFLCERTLWVVWYEVLHVELFPLKHFL